MSWEAFSSKRATDELIGWPDVAGGYLCVWCHRSSSRRCGVGEIDPLRWAARPGRRESISDDWSTEPHDVGDIDNCSLETHIWTCPTHGERTLVISSSAREMTTDHETTTLLLLNAATDCTTRSVFYIFISRRR